MNDLSVARPVFDRTTQDVGNIVEFGHVNTRVPDQRLATLFYIMGLGLTRDPYLNVGVGNMWVNVGTCQFHLPTGSPQVLRGTTGIVVPDLKAVASQLDLIAPQLAGTAFRFRVTDDTIETTSPWGNHLRLHSQSPKFGAMTLGMPYVELDTPIGTVDGIARFYRDIFRTPASTGEDQFGRFARIPIGRFESLTFRETDRDLPPFDGAHIQIAIADFSGPHARLLERGLITEESSDAQYRFADIVDLETGRVLVSVEHEVRSMRHPMFARVLVNRNAAVTAQSYFAGYEAWAPGIPPGH